jgi:beta-lactamase superfamily II metal-dependent hydrolase
MIPTTGAGEKSQIRNAFTSTSLESLQNVTIHFIDVGMGDSIFIETSGKNVLIDGGLPEAGQTVKSYLEDLNI